MEHSESVPCFDINIINEGSIVIEPSFLSMSSSLLMHVGAWNTPRVFLIGTFHLLYTNPSTTNATRSFSNLLKAVVLDTLPAAFHLVCGQKMDNNTTLPVFTTRVLYRFRLYPF